MIPALRHQSIIASLRAKGGLSVGELADDLHVSPSTIRRDLNQMEDDGVVHRTFGGAVLADEPDDPLRQVQLTNADAKEAIATAASTLVADGMTVLLDIGTTPLALAPVLVGRGLTVVTASLPTFSILATDPTARLVMLGGRYRSDYECMVGHMTVEALVDIRADIAFLGCSGLSADGTIRDTTLDQVPIKRSIMASADTTVLLADNSKFPGKGSYAVDVAANCDYLVTDRADLGELATILADHATEVIHV